MNTGATLNNFIRTLTPKRLRSAIMHAGYALVDGAAFVSGRRDPLVPPKRLLRISTDPSSDYRATGRSLVAFLVANCGLQPDHAVIDVGCGVGRVAVALTEFLDQRGRYEGFDIVPQEIAWCRRHVSPAFPRFNFQLADIANQAYNPSGHTRASDYRFPYDAGVFDTAIVASVFTHIFSDDVDRYVAELARVVKPGGRCLASFYLINDQSRRGIGAGTSRFAFQHRVGRCYVDNPDSPEWAVGHDEDVVRALFAREGFLVESVMHGAWSSAGVQSQDLIVTSRLS